MKNRVELKIIAIAFLYVTILNGCKKEEPITLPTPAPYICSEADGILCNVAGISGENGGSGNGGDALLAQLYWPMDITMDTEGRLLIVDFNNHCVRRIENDGTIDRIIGSGILGDHATGTALSINLNHPSEVTIGPLGNYWLSAWHNWKVKKIDKNSWEVTSPIGTIQGFSGDGGTADTARMDLPSSTVFGTNGDIFICDQGNQRIRKVDAVTHIITTLAGSSKGYADGIGAVAQFSFPTGTNAGPGGKMALTIDGNYLIIADTENNRIRKVHISTGEVSTIAGIGTEGYSGNSGLAIHAQLNKPTDVAIGPDKVIYIADSKNHVIRKIDASGNIFTVVGTGIAGSSVNGTLANEAMLNQPYGVYMTPDNTLYIADTYNQQVKKVKNP